IAKLTVNQSEIVMRGEVFGIDDESLLKLSHSLLKKIFLDYRVRMFHFRPLDIRLTKLVNHFVVLAEIKPAAFEFGVMVFKNAAEFSNRLVEKSILLVY